MSVHFLRSLSVLGLSALLWGTGGGRRHES